MWLIAKQNTDVCWTVSNVNHRLHFIPHPSSLILHPYPSSFLFRRALRILSRRWHSHRQKHGGISGHNMRKPAKLRDIARVPPFINDSHQEKERRGINAMVDHVEHGAV